MINGLQQALLTTTFRKLSQLHTLGRSSSALAAMAHSRLGLCAGSHQRFAAEQFGCRSYDISAHALRHLPPARVSRTAIHLQRSPLLFTSTAVQAATGDSPAAPQGQENAQGQENYQDRIAFDDSWINRVGVTGKVLKGPKLNHYYLSNTYKTVMVLGLYGQNTGDPFRDMPRTVLVQAWAAQAKALHQQIQLGDVIYLSGHLAIDLRRRNKFPGPMLSLRADAWSMIDLSSVPADRRLPDYDGEFDSAFEDYKPKPAPSTGADSQSAGRRRRRSTVWKAEALQMWQQGQPVSEIAAHFKYREDSVVDGLIQATLAEGYQSSAWPKLLEYLGLAGPNALDPAVVFDEIGTAIDTNTAPLTKEGKVRLTAIRDYLRSDVCSVAELIKQREESAAGDPSLTYDIIRTMKGLREMGGNPGMLQL